MVTFLVAIHPKHLKNGLSLFQGCWLLGFMYQIRRIWKEKREWLTYLQVCVWCWTSFFTDYLITVQGRMHPPIFLSWPIFRQANPLFWKIILLLQHLPTNRIDQNVQITTKWTLFLAKGNRKRIVTLVLSYTQWAEKNSLSSAITAKQYGWEKNDRQDDHWQINCS